MNSDVIKEIAVRQDASFKVEELDGGIVRLAFEGPPAPAEGKQPLSGMAFIRRVVRDVIKANDNAVPAGLVGRRSRNEDGSAGDAFELDFNTGIVDGLPAGWLPKQHRPGKPEEIVDLEAALPALGGEEPLAVQYFNSSVNEGIVVHDERVPVGLQFVVDDEGIHAKFLKASAVGGKKTWISRPVKDVHAAVRLVKNLLKLCPPPA